MATKRNYRPGSTLGYKGSMSPVLNAKPEPPKRQAPVSVRIPPELLERIEAAAAHLKLKRHDAILQMLGWAVVKAEREQGRKAKK